jgi:hypothetical protein
LFIAQYIAAAGLIDTNDIMSLPVASSAWVASASKNLTRISAKAEAKDLQSCVEACDQMGDAALNAALAGAAKALLEAFEGDEAAIPEVLHFFTEEREIEKEQAECVCNCDNGGGLPPPPCGLSQLINDCETGELVVVAGTPCPGQPMDPNEKVGPAGYSSAAFVSVQQPMVYTVYFANETNATAYVRQVGITDTLDPSLDILTFRLSEIAFGGVTITVPPNTAVYQTRVALPSPNPTNVVVDVSAVVDPQSRTVSWTMNAIDLNTGQLVANAQEGLLPPDNTNHTGEGHVTYSIIPKAGVATGTVVTNQAVIVFDINEPIPTNPTTNTIDGVPPTSTVTALPAVVVDTNFTVSWFGSGDPGGSGLQSYDIYVSDNGGPFQVWLGGVTQTNAVFSGQPGNSYGFYSIARDNAGNVEAAPSGAEASTFVSDNQPPTLQPIMNQTVNVGVALDLTNISAAPSSTNEQLTFSLEDAPPGASINPTNGQILWNPPPSLAGTTNLFTVSVTDNGVPPLTTSESFAVIVGNSVALSIATSGKQALTLTWSQGSLLQSTNLTGPWITNTTASPYTVVPSNSQMFFKVRVN